MRKFLGRFMKGLSIQKSLILNASRLLAGGIRNEPKFGGRKQKDFERNSMWSNLSRDGMCGDA